MCLQLVCQMEPGSQIQFITVLVRSVATVIGFIEPALEGTRVILIYFNMDTCPIPGMDHSFDTQINYYVYKHNYIYIFLL